MASTPATGKPRQLAPAVRFGFFLPLALLAGFEVVELLILPDSSAHRFAWTFSSPVSAATMGAAFAGGFALLVVAAWRRPWVEARLAWVSTMLLLLVALTVTLASAGRTHLRGGGDGTVAAWVYLTVLVAGLLIGVLALHRQDKAPVGKPAPSQPRSWGRLAPVAVVAAVATVLGIAMIVIPGRLDGSWPWQSSAMDVRGLGVWVLTYGLGSGYALWEADVPRLRAGAAAYLIGGVAGLGTFARFAGDMRYGSVGTWFYLVATVLLTTVGLAGLSLRRPLTRAAADSGDAGPASGAAGGLEAS